MIPTLLPMLATSSRPFDSDDYIFEVKWDGVRALAATEEGRWHMWGRDQADYSQRYPEMEVLRGLPSGTALDGELVVFQENGCTDFNALLGRHQLVQPQYYRLPKLPQVFRGFKNHLRLGSVERKSPLLPSLRRHPLPDRPGNPLPAARIYL